MGGAFPFRRRELRRLAQRLVHVLRRALPGWPHSWEGFIDRDGFVNQSASFGPATSVDAYLGWLYPYLPPFLMTYRVDGVIHFVPCLYLFLPVALIVLLFGPPMAFPYERRHFLLDREERKQRKKMKKERKARSRPKEA